MVLYWRSFIIIQVYSGTHGDADGLEKVLDDECGSNCDSVCITVCYRGSGNILHGRYINLRGFHGGRKPIISKTKYMKDQ